MRSTIRPTILFLLLPFLLSGCLFEVAPTGPSRSDNTWLLGVWEFEDADGNKKKAIVAPTQSDRMVVVFEEKNKGGKILRSGTYPAWISKVGQATLLVFEVSGQQESGYFLLGYQLLDPLTIRLREVTLGAYDRKPGAYGLRSVIRQAFREGTLFQGEQEIWSKTGEIFWQQGGDPAKDTFVPPRNVPAPTPDVSN